MGRGVMAAIGVVVAAVTFVAVDDELLAQTTCRSGGIQSESFAYGLHSGYSVQDVRPALRDELCFAFGRQAGLNLRSQFGSDQRCEAAYQDGFRQGLSAPQDPLVVRGVNACVMAGHDFGMAYLRVNARDLRADVVGASCVSAYGDGYRQGGNKRMPELPIDRRDAVCYLIGHRWATRAE